MSRVMSAPTTQPQPTTTKTATVPTHDQIAVRAYEKWVKRGRPQGSNAQDWLEAEMELKREMVPGSMGGTPRR